MTPDAGAEPFWTALAAGEVRLPACGACEAVFFPPGPICPRCGAAAVEWIDSAGTGALHAVTRQHRTAPGVPEPVVVGLVDLDEGPRLLARVAAPYEAVSIGTRVRLEPWAYDEGVDRGHLAGRPFFRAVPAD